jgi:UDP-N-acetylmuramoyl-tripeptide--D-alanyl-D-alanine ligase
VAPAHLEYFGTVEAIADAKAEIFEGVEPGGAAVLPFDNPHFARLKERARAAGVARIVAFGSGAGAEARLIESRPHGSGQFLRAVIAGRTVETEIGAAGAHIASNAVAALAAAQLLGADILAAAASLKDFAPLKGRGARLTLGGIEVIDESYNANPASMAAALSLLKDAVIAPRGRRIAVLGDMLELGDESAALHRNLAGAIADAGVDLVFLCGMQMRALWDALPKGRRGAYAETSAALAPELLAQLRPGDVVLAKGSFGSRMSAIVEALRARAAAAQSA